MTRDQIAEAARLDDEHTTLDAKIHSLMEQRETVRQRMASLGIRFETPTSLKAVE
jgi:hypothetical protein